MDFNQLKKKLFISLALGLTIFVALGIYSDFNKLFSSFLRFNIVYLPAILMLAPMNYLLRYVKWNYYLKLLNIKIDKKDNLKIFTSGLSMTITPGKLGEFMKSYLIKELEGIPMSVTSPLIVIERLTDGISMIVLASVGALKYKYGLVILVASIAMVAIFIASIRFKAIANFIIRVLKKLPLMTKLGDQIDAFYKSSYELLTVQSIIVSVFIGIVSWSFEGVVIYLTLKGFGTPISMLSAIFTVSFASIAGALSMLPGGLFVAEGSIMGLLIMIGVSKEVASAATIVTRFSTLWLGVAIGIVGLIFVQRRLAAVKIKKSSV